MGTVHLLDGLWRALGVDEGLRKVLGARRFTTDVERVLFALVANRAIDPMSKLSAAEWASCDVAIEGLEAMDEDQAYRAMDLLVHLTLFIWLVRECPALERLEDGLLIGGDCWREGVRRAVDRDGR